MKQIVKRLSALVVTLCMLLGCVGGAMAQGADLEPLYPLMDLVCAAALEAQGDDVYSMVVPDSEGELTPVFVDAFIRLGQTRGAALGITEAMMTDTMAQMQFLSTVFAAQLPTLSAVISAESEPKYIGFRPGTVNNTGENQTLQIIGEIYTADKPLAQLTDQEAASITWLDRGIFTFQSDSSALNGFRLMGFSTGTDLNMEEAFMTYAADTVTEYVDSQLGFTISYPAVFDDTMLQEEQNGVNAELPDKSASFFVHRIDNSDQSELQGYVDILAKGLPGAVSAINEQNGYGTLVYATDDGYTVFDIYVVTEKYIYQAELRYLTEKSKEFSMYNTYLENSFVVAEGGQG